jgi:hypothetical protein
MSHPPCKRNAIGPTRSKGITVYLDSDLMEFLRKRAYETDMSRTAFMKLLLQTEQLHDMERDARKASDVWKARR